MNEVTKSFFYILVLPQLLIDFDYSTLRGKTDKLEEAVNRELNVTRN